MKKAIQSMKPISKTVQFHEAFFNQIEKENSPEPIQVKYRVILDPIGFDGDSIPYNNLKFRKEIRHYDSFSAALKDHAQISHFNWINYYGIMKIARFVIKLITLKIYRIKIVWTVHETIPHEFPNYKLMIFQERLMARFADHITFFSDHDIDEFEQTVIKNIRHKSSVVECGLIPIIMPQSTYEQNKKELNLTNDKKIITYFGNIMWYKGVQDLVEVMGQIEKENPNEQLKLILIGRCGDPELKAQIQEKIEGIKDCIWIEEYLSDLDLAKYLFAADVIAMPFKRVSNSGTFLSAKRFPAKIVAPRTGCMPYQDHYGNPTFFYEANNINQLKETLLNAIHAPDAPKKLILDDFVKQEWQKIYLQTTKIYDSLIKK